MNSYEENVRAILQCCFSQSREDLIETAVKAIVAIKQEPIVINPIDTTPVMPIPMPTIPTPTYPQYPSGAPVITCDATTCDISKEDLKKFRNSSIIINKEKIKEEDK